MVLDLKREKGITLIALVVTIIILLILAGVSLGLLTGQNGIIDRSKESARKYNESSLNEQIKMNEIEQWIDDVNSGKGGTQENKSKGYFTATSLYTPFTVPGGVGNSKITLTQLFTDSGRIHHMNLLSQELGLGSITNIGQSMLCETRFYIYLADSSVLTWTEEMVIAYTLTLGDTTDINEIGGLTEGVKKQFYENIPPHEFFSHITYGVVSDYNDYCTYFNKENLKLDNVSIQLYTKQGELLPHGLSSGEYTFQVDVGETYIIKINAGDVIDEYNIHIDGPGYWEYSITQK